MVAALVICLWAICAPPAQAHGGPPRLELGAERINAGAALEVRGINIAPEQPITLALVGDEAEFSLGAATGDAHGDFTQVISLPTEAASGAYMVRAFGANRVMVSAPLMIVGAAANEEEGEQREQEEPLLAPMPQRQIAPQAQSGIVTKPTASNESVSVSLPLIALGALLLAVFGLVFLLRRVGGAY